MKRLQQITGAFFLWLAGIILMAHSIIPHHHHFESFSGNDLCHQGCTHIQQKDSTPSVCHLNDLAATDSEHGPCQACSFNTKTTLTHSNFSVELQACLTSIHYLLHPPKTKNTFHPVYFNHYLSFTGEKTSHRGPPHVG